MLLLRLPALLAAFGAGLASAHGNGTSTSSAESLLQALQSNGLTEFARFLQEDPTFNFDAISGRRIIIYAPTNPFLANREDTALARRETPEETQARLKKFKDYHARNDVAITLKRKDVCVSEGTAYETFLDGPEWVNLGPNRNQTLVEREVGPAAGPLVFTGLGASVKVTTADIPFLGGAIRPISGILTLPRNVSHTLPYLQADLFGTALHNAGLMAEVDGRAHITVLAPTDAVFRSGTEGMSGGEIAQVLKDHVLVDVPAYSPLLVNGGTFRTLGGDTVTVSTLGGVVTVDGANLVAVDAIVKNGVVHTIDKMINITNRATPTTAAPTSVVTGAAANVGGFSVVGDCMIALVAAAALRFWFV